MSSKFSCDLAEELYDYTLDSQQDDELGNSETFGWFALFREEGAIISVNSQGFVEVEQHDDVEAAWEALETRYSWFQLDHLDTTCDGLFLILDTARHGGWVPDFEEVGQHIKSCMECTSLGNYLEI